MAIYTVQPGDNLTKIAAKLSGMTGPVVKSYVAALASLNNIVNIDKIYIGQKLTYPDEWAAQPVRPVPVPKPVALPKPTPKPSIWQNPVMIGALLIGALLFLNKAK